MVKLVRVVGKYAQNRVFVVRQYSNGRIHVTIFSIETFKSLLKR